MHISKEETIETARQLIEVARHAPSVHNTQPWRFILQGDTLEFYVYTSRMLHAGDPTTRELWISLGIMFETIIQAAAALGVKIKVTSQQTGSLKKPIAVIQIISINQAARDKELLKTILGRHTHRGGLSQRPVEPSTLRNLSAIKDMPHLHTIEIITTANNQHRELASRLTEKGFSLAFSSAPFRQELSHLIHPNWTRARTGLPGFVLNKKVLEALWEKWSIRFGIGNAKKAKIEAGRVSKAPLLIFIAATGDIPKHWFAAGQAYALTTLELTRQGLLHSTIAAPVEAADYHRELEAALGTKSRLQCMIIAGYPTHAKGADHAPRLTTEELLSTLDTTKHRAYAEQP